MSPAAARDPRLEWAQRAASGQLDGLEWVDLRLDPDAVPFRQREDVGRRVFHHLPYAAFLPPAMVEAAQAAQEDGQATVLEGMQALFARLEWLIATRHLTFSPFAPRPRLSAMAVEAFGIGPDVHRGDPDALSRVVGLLPSWHPRRGSPEAATRMMQAAGLPEVELRARRADGEAPPLLGRELLACRSPRWWSTRAQGHPKPVYRIQRRFVTFQPEGEARFGLDLRDVLLGWDPSQALPKPLLRLLPPWTVLRVAFSTETQT